VSLNTHPASDLLALIEHRDDGDRFELSVHRCPAIAVPSIDDGRDQAWWFVDGIGWFVLRPGGVTDPMTSRLVDVAAPSDIERVVLERARWLVRSCTKFTISGSGPWVDEERLNAAAGRPPDRG
jgi:hypothetical protein